MKNNASISLFSDDEQLKANEFFKGFFTEENCTPYGWGPVLTYPSQTEIYQQDTPANAVYYILQGLVKVTWIDSAGHEMIAGLRRQHWLVGAPPVLLGKPYSFTVTTLSRAAFRCISADNFLHLVRTNLDFAMHLMKMLCQEIFSQGKNLVMLGCVSAGERLKGLLYRFILDIFHPAELHEQLKIHLPLKQKELAQMIAVTPEHLSRLMRELEQQRYIKREKNGLIFIDHTKLQKWAQQ
jgi:CRP/FNR family transcriptional regulator